MATETRPRLRPLAPHRFAKPMADLRALARYALQPHAWLSDNEVRVLAGGEQAFPAMLAAIGGATSEILFEVYTWENDRTGVRFCEALEARARAGVSVRVIADGVGALGLFRHLAERLRAAGVHVAEFHPLAPWRRRWGWSIRDHRKIMVVDGLVGFVGGFNVGDAYAPLSWGGGGWHDSQLSVRGPAVRELQKAFAQSWREATHSSSAPALELPPRVRSASAAGAHVQVLAVGGRAERRRIRRQYLLALRRARTNVYIQMAYFIPDRAWRSALAGAARRGVDVRVMFPSVSDVPAVQHASRATYSWLLRRGIKLYEWLPSMLHSKVITVDGRWYAVGSYNLDRRSLLYNWEVSLAVIHPPTARIIESRFESDISNCRSIERDEWEQRGWWARALEWFLVPVPPAAVSGGIAPRGDVFAGRPWLSTPHPRLTSSR